MAAFFLLAATCFLLVQIVSCLIAGWRCRVHESLSEEIAQLGGITVVRPLCGIETFTSRTLEAAFSITYPVYELLFCVARADDPVIPLVEAAIAAHPAVPARLLVGDDVISINPKLNNMVKGWRAARYEWIAFIDSNVLTPPDFVSRVAATWRPDTGAVSAPPVGCRPNGLWSHLECSFLNTYEARWQYAVDAFGFGFAQGKTLFYRKAHLDRSEMRELASDPAEDAATTKMVRRLGLRVRLAPPSPQPLGRRRLGDVWGRQMRWARLRRVTFLAEFLPEIFSGSMLPALCAGLAASGFGGPVFLVTLAFLAVWWGAEILLAAVCRWPLTWQTPLALAARDVMMPVIWFGAFTSRSFTWQGNAMTMAQRRIARDEVPG